MTEARGDWGRKAPPDGPSGFCAKCGRALDDHNNWLAADGPKCPEKGKP
jgi:hypothetical protein